MKIALWQTLPQTSIEEALTSLETVARTTAQEGADLLITPEMFVGGYSIGVAAVEAHAAQAGNVIERLQSIAAAHEIALTVGLAMPNDTRPRNACVVIDKTGVEIARYAKTHLYGDIDRLQFSAGETLSPIFSICGWRVGLAICYDIEFPELARDLALRGAELIVTPTANMVPFDSIASRLVPARAEESALFVAYCNYVGTEADFTYNGLSCVCGPDGNDTARADGRNQCILYATLTHAPLIAARAVQTHLQDRRADLYGALT